MSARKRAKRGLTAAHVLLADPKKRLAVAVHEVGHFALACATSSLPRGISIGGDEDTLGVCAGGGGGPPPMSWDGDAASFWLRQAAITLGGYVAEARLAGVDFWAVRFPSHNARPARKGGK